jgi:hypothetical protein
MAGCAPMHPLRVGGIVDVIAGASPVRGQPIP